MERGICVLILKAWRFSRLFLLLFFYIVFILCISFRPLFSLSFSLILSVGWLFSLFLLHFRHLLYIHIHFDLLGGFFFGRVFGQKEGRKVLGGIFFRCWVRSQGGISSSFFCPASPCHIYIYIYIYIHLSISFHSSSSWAFILLPFHLLIG